MNTPTNAPTHDSRRKHKFIDATVQGRLLFALIALELFLFTLAMFWLQHELSVIVEENLYRVHYSGYEDTSTLLSIVFMMAGVVLVINVMALWIADYIWRKYVDRVINALRDILSNMEKMDFSSSNSPVRTRHDVLDKAMQWQAQECRRYSDIQQVIAILPDKISPADENSRAEVERTLEKLQSLIKK